VRKVAGENTGNGGEKPATLDRRGWCLPVR